MGGQMGRIGEREEEKGKRKRREEKKRNQEEQTKPKVSRRKEIIKITHTHTLYIQDSYIKTLW